jgi:hypothetical protein
MTEEQRLEALGERLRAVPTVMPSPAAKIRGWNLVAASIERSTPAPKPGRSLRRLVLACAAVTVLLVASAVAASANSLPDSPLYPVKTALEQFRGSLAFTPSARLSYHLDLAGTRLTEAEAMIASHRVDLAGQSLSAMTQQLDDAASVVSAEVQTDPVLGAGMESRLEQAITVHDAQLAQLQGEVTNSQALAAIAAARDGAQQALQEAGGAGNGNGPHASSGGQGQPSQQGQGQGQNAKGAATPHPTPKK